MTGAKSKDDKAGRAFGLRARLLGVLLLALAPPFLLLAHRTLENRRSRVADLDASVERLARVSADRYAHAIEGARQTLVALGEAEAVRSFDARDAGAHFARLLAREPRYLNVGATDAAGRIVSSGLPTPLPVPAADRSWYRCAVAARDFCVGGYQVGRITGRPTLNVALPLVEGGDVRTVLFAAIDLEFLRGIAAADPLPAGAVLALLDADGRVLVRHAADGGGWEGEDLSPILRRFVADGGGEGRPAEATGPDGVRRRYALAPVLAAGRPSGLRVAYGLSVEEALAPIDRAFVRDLAILAALGAAVLLLVRRAAEHAVLAPARALAAAARRLGDGDLAARTGLAHGTDEFGTIARAFDEAAAALEAREAERAQAEARLRETEEQLRHAQKMEAVGRLAGGVAHDFNNILTVVSSWTETLLDETRPGTAAREAAEEIDRASRRAADLTRQLLAFGRKQVIAPRVIDLREVVGGLDGMIRRLIGEDISLRTVLPGDVGRVRADAGQIEQVLMNLVVNARDAMPRGGRLTIEVGQTDLDEAYVREHPEAAPGPHVTLAVSDTGCGMDAETRARIFEPFFTTKEKGKGTGLGLATVYGIVKQSGGSVYVYSEPGRGTTFKVYLPRLEEPAENPAPARPARPAAAARGSEAILLVEDDPAVREATRRVLERGGYRVSAAGGADEAVRIAKARPDLRLLVTDVVLERSGGRDLAGRIEALRPGIRVLYVSGYTENGIVHQGALDAGVEFLSKPFSGAAILDKVRAILDG